MKIICGIGGILNTLDPGYAVVVVVVVVVVIE